MLVNEKDWKSKFPNLDYITATGALVKLIPFLRELFDATSEEPLCALSSD